MEMVPKVLFDDARGNSDAAKPGVRVFEDGSCERSFCCRSLVQDARFGHQTDLRVGGRGKGWENRSSNFCGRRKVVRVQPPGPPLSPHHVHPPRSQSQHNLDFAASAPPPPLPPPRDEMNKLIEQLESAKLGLNAQIKREIINIQEQRQQISNPTSSNSQSSFHAPLPHRSSDSVLYNSNQEDSMLISTPSRQSLPPCSLIERGNGSFINAGFGVSENDGDMSQSFPDSRMGLSRVEPASGTTSNTVSKKKGKYVKNVMSLYTL
ncbi:hypothetical protein BJ741DRAFT_120193 [Chytriomyces cf. hyalinus JEL632]|nr:hypothetical protein BJ741DRAFT_120193 [Chytriomyces cf. hyalinus JEL632]